MKMSEEMLIKRFKQHSFHKHWTEEKCSASFIITVMTKKIVLFAICIKIP